MTSDEKIRAAAVRILGPMDAFKMGATAPAGVADPIGLYDAPGGPHPVWVTSAGLALPLEEGVEAVAYARILEVRAPESKDKADPESGRVRIVLDDGTIKVVDVVGGRGRFCDSFEFTRFLSRASSFARGT